MRKSVTPSHCTKPVWSLLAAGLLASVAWAGLAAPAQAEAVQEACPPDDLEERVAELEATAVGRGNTRVCVKGYGGYKRFNLPTRAYLARENLLTNQLQIGFISLQERLDGYNLGTEVEIARPVSVGGFGNYDTGVNFRFNIEYSDASGSQGFDQIDVGTGFGLGIPGAQGGASGAFLAANPQNIIQNAHYQSDLGWFGFDSNVEFRMEDPQGSYGKGIYAGVTFSDLSLEERFGGAIPGFNSDFMYHTQLDTTAFGAHVGLRGRHNLGNPIQGWQPQISARGRIGIAHVDADAIDSLNWNGFIAGAVPNSRIELSESATAAYYGAGAAVSLYNQELKTQLSLDLSWDVRPWFASIWRDGTNPSQLVIDDADVFSARFGIRRSF